LNYEERIASLVEKHITNRPIAPYLSTADLVSALGCRNIGDPNRLQAFDVPEQPNPEYEALVVSTLLLTLHSHLARPAYNSHDGLAIIDGLMRNQRWRECLKDLDTAYAFAILLSDGSLAPDDRKPVDPDTNLNLKRTVEIDARIALQDWIPNVVHPLVQPRRLVKAMFGEVWFDLVVVGLDIATHHLPDAIKGLRPPFSPGLLPPHLEPVVLPLPALST
jgi:hypothetical protein